jgi:hypothetical protein
MLGKIQIEANAIECIFPFLLKMERKRINIAGKEKNAKDS